MSNRYLTGAAAQHVEFLGMHLVDRSHLRPELRALLEAEDGMRLPTIDQLTLGEARASSEIAIAELWGPVEPVAAVDDLSVDAGSSPLRARLYRPGRSLGTLLFLHGGGWVVGNVDTHDGPCRMLANAVPCDVLSVEYRKAPESPFPSAVEDADGSLAWLLENGQGLGLDPTGVIVAGESAGANLAAVLARHARDRHISLAGQVLVTPPTDAAMATGSAGAFAAGFRLTAASMAWFMGHYLAGGGVATDPDVSPLRATTLAGLAPGLIITAEFDPLRDEGRAYAARLIKAGNDVTYVESRGTIHGVFVMNAVTPAAAQLIADIASWVRSRWSLRRADPVGVNSIIPATI